MQINSLTTDMQTIVTSQTLNPSIISPIDIIFGIGIAAIILGLIYIGKKLQILDDLKTTSGKVKTNLKVIGDFLVRNNANFNPSELQVLSPLALTSEGENFIKTIGFDNVFRDHEIDFFKYIEDEDPKLKYDVETASIKSISAFYEKEYMNFLKVFLYNNPTRTLDNTAPTLGVYIRERYLSKHPEITE